MGVHAVTVWKVTKCGLGKLEETLNKLTEDGWSISCPVHIRDGVVYNESICVIICHRWKEENKGE